MRHTFVVMLFAAFIFLLGCSESSRNRQDVRGPDTFTRVVTTKKLRAGYIVFPPVITKDVATGELDGHFVATIKEIARQAEWDLEFVESDWATFSAGLASNRFDVSIAPTFVTIPRAMSVAFTRPLFYAGNSAIVRSSETRFSTVDSLDQADVTIAVTQGEAGHEYATANFKNAKLIVHPGADQTLTFHDVLTGRADAALGDAYVTSQFAKLHSDKVKDLFAQKPYNLTPVSWAVQRGDSGILQFLNSAIDSLDSTGYLKKFEDAAGAHWLHVKREWDTN